MKVPLLDLKKQYETIADECLHVTKEIYKSQRFIMGPWVERLEEEIARYCGTGFAVGVSSGTDALLISLMAAGVKSGDLVITTPYTFFATAGAIARVGAVPVFVDIEPRTYNMDPVKLHECIESMDIDKRKKVKAIIPVHLYGQCADMDPIISLALEHSWVVIEDAAQAIGAVYKGRKAGSMGDFGCFSFFPSKNLGAFGDGGMVTTNDPQSAEHLKVLRVHGASPKYYHRFIGGNFRLDALQAAIVSIKLPHLESWTHGRRRNARRYRELFSDAGLLDIITLPVEVMDNHIYNQFVISVREKRDELKNYLLENGVGCEIYYPVPLHLQECFSYLGYKPGDLRVSEYAALHTLAIPIFPELTADQQAFVVERIKRFYRC